LGFSLAKQEIISTFAVRITDLNRKRYDKQEIFRHCRECVDELRIHDGREE
jgi:hypothetical protein